MGLSVPTRQSQVMECLQRRRSLKIKAHATWDIEQDIEQDMI